MSIGLMGKHIVNTRATHHAADFDKLIQAYGAVPLSYPCIAIQLPDDLTELDTALRQLIAGAFDWLVLTSTNTVLSISQRMASLNLSFVNNRLFRTAAVGTSTAQAAADELGLHVDLIPDAYVAESLAQALLSQDGRRVLLPESAIARPTLAQALTSGGANVRVVTAYRTVCGRGGVDLLAQLRGRAVDAITFTSSSTVTCCAQRFQTEGGDGGLATRLEGIPVVCIGPKTAKTATEHGLTNLIVPEEYTLDGMLQATAAYFANIVSEK